MHCVQAPSKAIASYFLPQHIVGINHIHVFTVEISCFLAPCNLKITLVMGNTDKHIVKQTKTVCRFMGSFLPRVCGLRTAKLLANALLLLKHRMRKNSCNCAKMCRLYFPCG